RYFRKEFTVDFKVGKAILSATGDDEIVVYFNGKQVIDSKGWDKAAHADVTKSVRQGRNLIAIRGKNVSADAGVIAMLEMESGRKKQFVMTDTSWASAATAGGNWFQDG